MKTSRKVFLMAALGLFSLQGIGQEPIKISGTRFAYPLIERWIAEYGKTSSTLSFELLPKAKSTEKIDIRVVGRVVEKSELQPNEEVITVSRFALLPIANDKNDAVQKYFKKGLKSEDLKRLFFEDPEDELEAVKGDHPQYKVYTHNSRVCSSVTFARHFKDDPEHIFGKTVTGDDKHLLDAVKRDALGITYNNLGYVYDLSSRTLQKGIAVLPIDINKNGKLEKEEQIYQNLDDLISFLEINVKKQFLPTEYISFIVDKEKNNEAVKAFTKWIQKEGQNFAHEYGFLHLSNGDQKSAFNSR